MTAPDPTTLPPLVLDGPSRPAAVLIVDDHPLVRDGLRSRLDAAADLTVCGEAATPAEARRLADLLTPDLVLLGFDPTDEDGAALLREFGSRPGSPAVLALIDRDDAAERALKLGARGVASKRASGDAVLAAARDVAAGRRVLPDDLIARLVRRRPPAN